MIDLNSLRDRSRAVNILAAHPIVALWREDLKETRANLAIEGIDLNPEDGALFAILLEKSLSLM